MKEFILDGEILFKKSTYSSEWNWVISRFVAGLARYTELPEVRREVRVRYVAEGLAHENLHPLVEAIVHDERMAHPYPCGLHSENESRQEKPHS